MVHVSGGGLRGVSLERTLPSAHVFGFVKQPTVVTRETHGAAGSACTTYIHYSALCTALLCSALLLCWSSYSACGSTL